MSCGITQLTGVPTVFSFQSIDSKTGEPIGPADTPSGPIPDGSSWSALISLTPVEAFNAMEIEFGFNCSNSERAATIPGVNTLTLSASDTPTPAAAKVSVSINRNTFRAGETALMGFEASYPIGSLADLYLGVLTADGHTIVWLSSDGAFGGVADITGPAAVPPTQSALSEISLRRPIFLEYTFPADGIPGGTYYVFAALVAQGRLLDNKLDSSDILAFDSKAFTFVP